MKFWKKSLLASLAVQLAFPLAYLSASCLPAGAAQNVVVLLFPFVAGIPLGPLLLRPFTGMFARDVVLNLAMISALVGNFMVYAIVFQGWFLLRNKLRVGQQQTVSV
ncbi:MAG: hypothetical protein U0Y68_02555 [Blastocatellia bacterium]